MKLEKETKLLVIVGAWNRQIFSKEWIAKFLLPKSEFDLELSLSLASTHRISTKDIRIEFHSNSINFVPLTDNQDIYSLITDLANKLADYLPHTPVIAYGVNFIFEYDADKIQLQLLKENDFDKLSDQREVRIITSQHKRSIRIKDILTNITINNDESRKIVTFDFNFHFNISSLIDFKDKIYNCPVEKLYDNALNLIKDVYQIQTDGE